MTSNTMTIDRPLADTTDCLLADDRHLDRPPLPRLGVNDLDGAGWGAAWHPEDRLRRDWIDAADQPEPDEGSWSSTDDWDLWPVLERSGESRCRLFGP
jgi:hypothetical protein